MFVAKRKMQFFLQSASPLECGSGCGMRRGKLAWTTPNEGVSLSLDTPLCLLYSRAGSVPNLTRDVMESLFHIVSHVTGCVDNEAILLTMPTMYMNSYRVPAADVLEEFKEGIHKFLNRESQLLYLSVQDVADPISYRFNCEKSVSIWTKHGRSKVTVSDHMMLLRSFRPNVFECLYDYAPSSENKMKRICKSVDRTLRFLDETVEALQTHQELETCSFLGAIVGSNVRSERERSARETAIRPVDGFVLEGFNVEEDLNDLRDIISCVTDLLPQDKPRFIYGLYKPEDIFDAFECGVDVFESSYAYKAAEKGCAVVFPWGHKTPEDVEGEKLEHEESYLFEIDLTDKKYEADFNPFLSYCGCYACCHHNRAYTYHLLATNEILAKILIMIHNLSHYLIFFAKLRTSLHRSTYKQFKTSCLGKSL